MGQRWKRWEHGVVADLKRATGLPWRRILEFRRHSESEDSFMPPGDLVYARDVPGFLRPRPAFMVECKNRDSWPASKLAPPHRDLLDMLSALRVAAGAWRTKLEPPDSRHPMAVSLVVRAANTRFVLSTGLADSFGVYDSEDMGLLLPAADEPRWILDTPGPEAPVFLQNYSEWLRYVHLWAGNPERGQRDRSEGRPSRAGARPADPVGVRTKGRRNRPA